MIRGDSASNGLYSGFRLDGGIGNFAWHADGYNNEHRDLTIPSYASVNPFPEEEHDEEEEAFNLSFGVEYEEEPFEASINIYRYNFDNFIYQQVTDEIDHGLPVIQWQQSEATLVGGDIGGGMHFSDLLSDIDGMVSIGYDLVRTDLKDPHEPYLPRSPASRFWLSGEITFGDLCARLSYSHVFDQEDHASHETATASYNNIDVEAEYALHLKSMEEAIIMFKPHARPLTYAHRPAYPVFIRRTSTQII